MSLADVVIVPATLADASDIYALKMRAFEQEGRLVGSMDIPPLQEDLQSVEHDIRTHSVVIARLDGRTVGSARGELAGTSCAIRAVCVDPEYQGRGVGAALMTAIEQAHPDVAEFKLTTNILVPGNVAFYFATLKAVFVGDG